MATPTEAIAIYDAMVAAGIELTDEPVLVRALFSNGAWDEDIPEVDGWTIVPVEDTSQRFGCTVNLFTRTFAFAPIKDSFPALYVDAAIVPTDPTEDPDAPACNDSEAILLGEQCIT